MTLQGRAASWLLCLLIAIPAMTTGHALADQELAWRLALGDADAGPRSIDLGDAEIRVPAGSAAITYPPAKYRVFDALRLPADHGAAAVLIDPAGGPIGFATVGLVSDGYVPDARLAEEPPESQLDLMELIRGRYAAFPGGHVTTGETFWEVVDWIERPNLDADRRIVTWSILLEERSAADPVRIEVRHAAVPGRLSHLRLTTYRLAGAAGGAAPGLDALMAAVSFKEGQRHADHRSEDRLSDLDLAGLVIGRSLAASRKEQWWLAVGSTALVPLLVAIIGGLGGLAGLLLRRRRKPG